MASIIDAEQGQPHQFERGTVPYPQGPTLLPPVKKPDLLPGFPDTSNFIALDPAKTTVIFRRFDHLAVRNLLYLEARLTALEKLQTDYDRNDARLNSHNEPITTAARSWEDFAVFGTDPQSASKLTCIPLQALTEWRAKRKLVVEINRRKAVENRQEIRPESEIANEKTDLPSFDLDVMASQETPYLYDNPLGCGPYSLAAIQARWNLAAAIEATLKEYQDAVLRYREMLKLEPPAERTKRVISAWIAGTPPGLDTGRGIGSVLSHWPEKIKARFTAAFQKSLTVKGFEVKRQFQLGSSMHGIYHARPAQDFVGVGRTAGVDLMTRWVSIWKPLFWFFSVEHFGYPGLDYVPESVIHGTTTILMVIAAVIMLIGGIWGLYYLRTEQNHFYWVLILLSFLIVIFAALMKVMTTSSRAELFGATAGYAAVLVVFVAFQAPNA